MKLLSGDAIRAGMRQLPLDISHNAARPPQPKEIYTPKGHAGALDPDRAIVVGNRGVGKSFWSGALIEPKTRDLLAAAYPRLKLSSVNAVLGFSGDDFSTGIAPSPEVLRSLQKSGFRAEIIWRSVFLKAVDSVWEQETFRDVTSKIDANPELYERAMFAANVRLSEKGRKKLLVFDALDRLGGTWDEVRDLTRGLLRLSLSLRSYPSIRSKIFIRPDQSDDKLLFDFADASKLRAERVELRWATCDLYGLLFNSLINFDASRVAFEGLLESQSLEVVRNGKIRILPEELKTNEHLQAEIFKAIAGNYMGSDHRRGRTYSWLPNHLGDAHGQTAPRTFLTALKIAAEKGVEGRGVQDFQAIDHHGIKEGVQSASGVRIDQLAEDHIWIRPVLESLKGIEVPCEESAIVDRWKSSGVVRRIRKDVDAGKYLGPLELLRANTAGGEVAILESLTRLGVTERRSNGKINIPDIFRVAASIKRRGGVKPPTR